MTYLAAGNPGTVDIVGQPVSAWTLIVLLIGIIIGVYLRHKI
jgi:hypothetical protein